MKLGRKKIKCSIGKSGSQEMMELSFQGDHWSFFFPNVKRILEKGLKPCSWIDVSEGRVSYSIATDDYSQTLKCEEGEVYVHDDSYGLSLIVRRDNQKLLQRIMDVLQASGRFEIEREEM
jgi:hypothetical protein